MGQVRCGTIGRGCADSTEVKSNGRLSLKRHLIFGVRRPGPSSVLKKTFKDARSPKHTNGRALCMVFRHLCIGGELSWR